MAGKNLPTHAVHKMHQQLLLVWHSRTGAARQMAAAAAEGIEAIACELQAQDRLRLSVLDASEAQPQHVLAAQGYLFCAPENLGTVSGSMKEFFDRCYYPALDQLNGRPYGLMVAAGSDGSGAVRQVERICTGWRLNAIAPALIVHTNAQTPEDILAPKVISEDDRQACYTLGGTLAALVL